MDTRQWVSHPDNKDGTEGTEEVMSGRVTSFSLTPRSSVALFARSNSLPTFFYPFSASLVYRIFYYSYYNEFSFFSSPLTLYFVLVGKNMLSLKEYLHSSTTIFSLLNSSWHPFLFLLLNFFLSCLNLLSSHTYLATTTDSSSWNLVCNEDSTSSFPILLKLLSQRLLVSF